MQLVSKIKPLVIKSFSGHIASVTLQRKIKSNFVQPKNLNLMIKQVFFFVIALLFGLFSAKTQTDILSAEVRGAGKPMILIHGMACSADVWEEVADFYQSRHELHLITLPGFGNQEPFEAPHVLKAIRDALIAYVTTNELDKPLLMGHSMGGFVSLWAAAEAPELFRGIISVDGLPYFPVLAMPGMTAETAGPFVQMMQDNMRNSDPQTSRMYQEMMIASMISNEEKRPVVVEMGVNSNPAVIAQAMGEMYTTDIRDEMKNIDIPVLVLGSWYAYRSFGATLESVKAGFTAQFDPAPHATVKMADTAYHFIFYDDPDWFFKVVDEFLAQQWGL